MKRKPSIARCRKKTADKIEAEWKKQYDESDTVHGHMVEVRKRWLNFCKAIGLFKLTDKIEAYFKSLSRKKEAFIGEALFKGKDKKFMGVAVPQPVGEALSEKSFKEAMKMPKDYTVIPTFYDSHENIKRRMAIDLEGWKSLKVALKPQKRKSRKLKKKTRQK